jgi:carboxypeptidase Taq
MMDDAVAKLDALLGEVVDLRHTTSLLSWDERVCMPAGGAPAHGEMLATVRRLAHEKFTSDEVGRLIEQASAALNSTAPGSDAARKLRVTARDYDKAIRVPPAYVAEQARVTSAAHQAWREARAASDFRLFEPHLEKVVDLKRRYVGFFQPTAYPYDALLDDFEPGGRTAEIKAMFDVLRPRQVALLRAIHERPSIDDRFLHVLYAESDMLAFSVEAITAFGFDWTRGRQDKSTHPFETAIGPDDVRITTRYDAKNPFEMLFSSLHETGHALYEQGVNPAWGRTLLRGGTSLGVHESQSRLWENLIGRSRPFWEHFFPLLKRRFPSQVGSLTLDQFYRGINKVAPSLIRVEADEVTYNLHVMLRVEMEIGMLAGEFPLNEAPEVWNAKMSDYLGVTPTSAANGILQDVHWSAGLFGYFATYTIGNLISVQLWDTFRGVEPACDEQIRRGEFSRLRGWLKDSIHQHGRSYEPREILQRVTGSVLDPAPYLDYLDRKYRDVYGL